MTRSLGQGAWGTGPRVCWEVAQCKAGSLFPAQDPAGGCCSVPGAQSGTAAENACSVHRPAVTNARNRGLGHRRGTGRAV